MLQVVIPAPDLVEGKFRREPRPDSLWQVLW
jgi:hypothetical protein